MKFSFKLKMLGKAELYIPYQPHSRYHLFRCEHIIDYFPKAASYSGMGDLFVVAVKNDEQEIGDLESNAKRRDVILRLDHLSRTVKTFHSTDQLDWVSDLTVLRNNDILLW